MDAPTPTPTRVGLLLIDGFALMSYAAFIEPLRAANKLARQNLYRWQHISVDGCEIRASNGATLLPDSKVGAALDADMLVVFAAGDPASFRHEACFAWLRALARQGLSMVGVSGGPYLLARAGLLAGRAATIHWEHVAAFREDFPDVLLKNSVYVLDGQRITCAGGTAGMDLAIRLVEDRHGPHLAAQVGEWFIRSEPRQADVHQRSRLADRYGAANPRLLMALAVMEAAIEQPLSCEEVAAKAGISLRQLERICWKELHQSLREAYIALRLEHGEHLLRSTGLSVTEIAMACGFKSPGHFSRRFARKFGVAPSRHKP